METITVHRPDDLGPELRDVRIARGLTQSGLAAQAKVGRQWLNGFELGDKWTAPVDMVMRVITALNVTVALEPEPPRATRNAPGIDLNEVLGQVGR